MHVQAIFHHQQISENMKVLATVNELLYLTVEYFGPQGNKCTDYQSKLKKQFLATTTYRYNLSSVVRQKKHYQSE